MDKSSRTVLMIGAAAVAGAVTQGTSFAQAAPPAPNMVLISLSSPADLTRPGHPVARVTARAQAAQPIEPPAQKDIHLPAPRIGDEPIESRTTILRARNASIDVLLDGPAAGIGVAPKLRELILWFLIER